MSEYAVARSTVREALKLLELKGYTRIEHGRGSLCQNLLAPLVELPLEGVGDNRDFQIQVMEMRATLEGEAAYFAAKRATDEELELIAAEYRAMQQRDSEGTTLAKAKADLRFHTLIAESSHNLLLISFSQVFYSRYFNAIYSVLDQTLKRYGRYPDGISAQHHQIFHALLNRNAELARQVAADHIHYTRRKLQAED